MGRYGVTANAIAPAARTRMTEEVFGERMQAPDSGFDANDPGEHLAARRVARQRGVARRDRAGVRGRGRHDLGRRRLAARTERRPGRALGAGRGRRGRARAAREGAAARSGVRHAMTRAHPAPPEVQAEWRALGVWTDETLLDRLARVDGATLAIVDGDDAPDASTTCERASRGTRGRPLGDRRAARRRRRAGNSPTGGKASCCAGPRGAAARSSSPITPSLRAREVGFILRADRRARRGRARASSAAPTTRRSCARPDSRAP